MLFIGKALVSHVQSPGSRPSPRKIDMPAEEGWGYMSVTLVTLTKATCKRQNLFGHTEDMVVRV